MHQPFSKRGSLSEEWAKFWILKTETPFKGGSNLPLSKNMHYAILEVGKEHFCSRSFRPWLLQGRCSYQELVAERQENCAVPQCNWFICPTVGCWTFFSLPLLISLILQLDLPYVFSNFSLVTVCFLLFFLTWVSLVHCLMADKEKTEDCNIPENTRYSHMSIHVWITKYKILISVLIRIFHQFGLRKMLLQEKKRGGMVGSRGKSATIVLAFSPSEDFTVRNCVFI